ncbi:hypothetical protein LCGC14_0709160 [marine sediment metagenome]|uniref:GTP-binding protein n=1 Tax=marine sediment metagenome TaxID=412755 RepID=A0A0F9TN57_9ZZZZ
MTDKDDYNNKVNGNGRPIYIFKVVLLGQERVGKTCIAKRLCFNTFDVDTKETLGIEFYTHDLPIIVNGDKSFVRISIWDFGGREQFKKLFPYYINGANGIFMVFNLIDLQTLLRLDWWYERLGEYNHGQTPRMFIGAKHDLVKKVDEKSTVDDLVVDRFIQRHAEVEFYKTSSKDNYNIEEIVRVLIIKILEKNKLDYDQIT